ncbi:glycosyltransferase, partial [Candidatus Saccharibacteria bacterium]|nr:glycosyltransferase [Candidatus Saccharibacteria bacterium]
DVDDLVVGGNWLRPMMEATGVRVEKNWQAQGDDYEAAAKRTDGFTTTNDFLGRKLEESFDRSYKVIYNSIGEEFMGDYSGVKHDGFVIGYFSGSPTHANDFGVVAPELTQLLEKYPEMRLLLVGDMELPASMWKFINNGQIIRRAKVNYLKLPELIASVDVNIAPLLINDFTNAKSELKYFEAAAATVVTVATPSFTFKQAIVDGENGFLAEQGEWYAKIEYLYQHPEERQKIARKAKKEALKIYHGANIMKQAEEAYEYFTKTK